MVRISSDLKYSMQSSHDAMASFFLTKPDEFKFAHQSKVPEASGGLSLLGYNRPTPAKELYRFRLDHPCRPALPELERE